MGAFPHGTGQVSSTLRELAQREGFMLFRNGPTWRLYSDPIRILTASDPSSLQQAFARTEQHLEEGGEIAGVVSYEAGYALEPRLRRLLPGTSDPICFLGLYRSFTRIDNIPFLDKNSGEPVTHHRLSIDRDQYFRKIAAIRRLIEAGDVYQINFTTRLRFRTNLSAWDTFATLLRRHPVPYAAFLNLGSAQILSLSPELFFHIHQQRITVQPMKGTAARGRFLKEDLLAARQLRQSDKNRAENLMIVDLMRNDLGRISTTGTVTTPVLFEVERFPSLWQMTSTVQGNLKQGCSLEAIFRALFPSGSVTGAPKIRAMEQIANLEDSPRGAYTGAIGFLSPGRACFNVAIRTLVLRQDEGIMGVGGGITYDSSAFEEWLECQWKAAFLIRSEPEFGILETLYWNGRYRLLDAHVARMRESAEYFGFGFVEQRVRSTLRQIARNFSLAPRRIRIVLSKDGGLETTDTDLGRKRFGKVGISSLRVSSQDRFLFHKTTNRRLFDEKLMEARRRKLDDFLFFNERDELTEGTIHNVFVVKDGIWHTPPVECGLLPGTFRGRLLRRRNVQETTLGLHDLRTADSVYLCNSVRGLFPVKVVWGTRLDLGSSNESARVAATDLPCPRPDRRVHHEPC